MTYAVSPLVGVDTANVVDASHPDSHFTTLGQTFLGSDGKIYILAEAGGTLAAGAACLVTEGTFVTGAGTSHEVPAELTGGVVLGDVFWARTAALPA